MVPLSLFLQMLNDMVSLVRIFFYIQRFFLARALPQRRRRPTNTKKKYNHYCRDRGRFRMGDTGRGAKARVHAHSCVCRG